MRPVIYVLSFLFVMGLGFWVYNENYATQAALREVAALQDEIAQIRDNLAVQKAEWAYLNRPSRLRDLAKVNFDRLGLMSMDAAQFGTVKDITYPLAANTAGVLIDNPMDVSGLLIEAEITPSGEVQTP
jgi:hypothetical protein